MNDDVILDFFLLQIACSWIKGTWHNLLKIVSGPSLHCINITLIWLYFHWYWLALEIQNILFVFCGFITVIRDVISIHLGVCQHHISFYIYVPTISNFHQGLLNFVISFLNSCTSLHFWYDKRYFFHLMLYISVNLFLHILITIFTVFQLELILSYCVLK